MKKNIFLTICLVFFGANHSQAQEAKESVDETIIYVQIAKKAAEETAGEAAIKEAMYHAAYHRAAKAIAEEEWAAENTEKYEQVAQEAEQYARVAESATYWNKADAAHLKKAHPEWKTSKHIPSIDTIVPFIIDELSVDEGSLNRYKLMTQEAIDAIKAILPA